MAECLHRADAQRPFEGSEKQKSDICVSVTPRYGVLKVWALLLHETPRDMVQPEGFTQAVLLWMMVPTCLSLSTSDPDGPFFPEGFSPLHTWFRETFFFSALIAAFKHWPQASHWAFLWVRDCNVFPFMKHQVSSH